MRDLRTKLHEALTDLGIQTSDYEDQTLAGAPNGTLIKKVHITQLRQRTTSGLGGAGGSSANQFGAQWLVTDQLGSPRMVFDEIGSLGNVKRHDYLPFGEALVAGGRATTPGYGAHDGVRQKFTGYEHDGETELEFAQARYYSGTQGRFTGVDPIGGTVVDPQTWNRYAYVGNNPVNITDPTGMNYFMGGGVNDAGIAEFRSLGAFAPSLEALVYGKEPKKKPNPPTEGGPLGVPIQNPCTEPPCKSPIDLGTVTVTSEPDLIDYPGPPNEFPGDSYVERYVSSPVRTALEVVSWASQGFRNFAYAITPDYFYVNAGFPLVFSGGLQYSKDHHLFWSWAGPTFSLKNAKIGGQFGAAYFLSTDMKPDQRDASIQGPGLNITTPFNPFGAYIPESGRPAITIGGPFSAGVNGSYTQRIR